MKKKYLIVICIVLFIVILYFTYPRNYTKEYIKDSYKIKEEYNKSLKIHYIKVYKDQKEYEFIIENGFKKKIVQKIDYYKDQKYTCLNIKIKKQETLPVCYKGNELIDVYLLNNININKHYNLTFKNKEIKKKTINKTNIYNYNNLTYLIWNYKGFDYFNKQNYNSIKITKEDVYSLNIIEKIDNFLLMADYNQDYNFNKFIIINLKTGKKEIWNIDYEISMDSYILGTYDKSIYLVDRKNKVEYELVPSHKKMRIVSKKNKGLIYQNGFKEISMNKLIKEEKNFQEEKAYNFEIKNNQLYMRLYHSKNYCLISNQKDLKIIDVINENVYYLNKDKLYVYNIQNKETLLLENFEWNFNYKNMIYIYN